MTRGTARVLGQTSCDSHAPQLLARGWCGVEAPPLSRQPIEGLVSSFAAPSLRLDMPMPPLLLRPAAARPHGGNAQPFRGLTV